MELSRFVCLAYFSSLLHVIQCDSETLQTSAVNERTDGLLILKRYELDVETKFHSVENIPDQCSTECIRHGKIKVRETDNPWKTRKAWRRISKWTKLTATGKDVPFN